MKALALVVLAGCSGGNDGIDLAGVYMVTSDVSSMPCGSDMAVTGAPAYLHFKKDNTLGVSVWVFEGCSDAAATMCQSGGGFYVEPITDGWQGIESSDSFSGGTSCYLGYAKDTAILKNAMMVVDDSNYADMPALDMAHCTTAEAEKRNTTMPCVMHEHIEATKL